jgi:hypothetical protein
MHLMMRHVILDEAQQAKHVASLTHRAILNLSCRLAVPVTGTPTHNRYSDVLVLIQLLKDEPVKDLAKIKRV